jgi:hypothetical protein
MEDSHVTWLKITDPSTGTIVAAAKWIVWPPHQTPAPDQLEAESLGVGNGEKKRWPDKVDVNWVLPEEKGLNFGPGSDDQAYGSCFRLLLFPPEAYSRLARKCPSHSHFSRDNFAAL